MNITGWKNNINIVPTKEWRTAKKDETKKEATDNDCHIAYPSFGGDKGECKK